MRVEHIPLTNGEKFEPGETVDVIDSRGKTIKTYIVRSSGPGWFEPEPEGKR